MITLTNLTAGFYLQVLQNGFLQADFFFFLFRVFIYLTSFELILPLLPLQYCSNLLSISSENTLVLQWKNLKLHNFSFNWKVAVAVASFNHTRPRGVQVQVSNCSMK